MNHLRSYAHALVSEITQAIGIANVLEWFGTTLKPAPQICP